MIDAVVIQPGVDAGEPSGSAQASSTAGASFLHLTRGIADNNQGRGDVQVGPSRTSSC